MHGALACRDVVSGGSGRYQGKAPVSRLAVDLWPGSDAGPTAGDAHVLGLPDPLPRVQAEETGPLSVPRLLHARRARAFLPRGAPAQPPAGAGYLPRRRAPRAARGWQSAA